MALLVFWMDFKSFFVSITQVAKFQVYLHYERHKCSSIISDLLSPWECWWLHCLHIWPNCMLVNANPSSTTVLLSDLGCPKGTTIQCLGTLGDNQSLSLKHLSCSGYLPCHADQDQQICKKLDLSRHVCNPDGSLFYARILQVRSTSQFTSLFSLEGTESFQYQPYRNTKQWHSPFVEGKLNCL